MSESSKEKLDSAKEYLKEGGKYLKKAGDLAGAGGDKGAQQRIQKIAESAGQEAADIEKKLGGPKQA
jgi:hypothetical protein